MKELTDKQLKAIELLTCGKGLTYAKVAEEVGIHRCTLWEWQQLPTFQAKMKEVNDQRWLATVDLARQAAARLCENGNQRMVEFVLKNEGYNPVQKVEAEVSTDIEISIGE